MKFYHARPFGINENQLFDFIKTSGCYGRQFTGLACKDCIGKEESQNIQTKRAASPEEACPFKKLGLPRRSPNCFFAMQSARKQLVGSPDSFVLVIRNPHNMPVGETHAHRIKDNPETPGRSPNPSRRESHRAIEIPEKFWEFAECRKGVGYFGGKPDSRRRQIPALWRLHKPRPLSIQGLFFAGRKIT